MKGFAGYIVFGLAVALVVVNEAFHRADQVSGRIGERGRLPQTNPSALSGMPTAADPSALDLPNVCRMPSRNLAVFWRLAGK
jgi:hypothetical protein